MIKRLEGDRPAVLEVDADDLVARWRVAIPRSAHGDEGVAAILFRKPVAFVEGYLHRRGMRRVKKFRIRALRRPFLHGDAVRRLVLRVMLAVGVDVGPAIFLALLDQVQFLVLLVGAEPIDSVIHALERAGLGLEAEADRVAQARAKIVRLEPSGSACRMVALSGLDSAQALQVEPAEM